MNEIELQYLGFRWWASRQPDPFPMSADRGYGVSPAHEASVSAMATALTRAAHARLDPEPIFLDTWGDLLVPELARESFIAGALSKADAQARVTLTREAILDVSLVNTPGYANIIVRSRHTEDALQEAVGRGIGQYVLIGAGFDSFLLRRPAFAQRLTIFEVDRHATQAFKRQRIAACGLEVPAGVHFVPADLAREDLGTVLLRNGFQAGAPAFFSWLGVTMFLSRTANFATLASVAAVAAPGSEVVFTYLDQQIYQSGASAFLSLQASVQSMGEPLQGGFDPQQLDRDLRTLGFELLHDFSDAQLVQRLAGVKGADRLRPLEHSRIAHARRLAGLRGFDPD